MAPNARAPPITHGEWIVSETYVTAFLKRGAVREAGVGGALIETGQGMAEDKPDKKFKGLALEVSNRGVDS